MIYNRDIYLKIKTRFFAMSPKNAHYTRKGMNKKWNAFENALLDFFDSKPSIHLQEALRKMSKGGFDNNLLQIESSFKLNRKESKELAELSTKYNDSRNYMKNIRK